MAAAARPSEARVPCPVCSAPIHPIAGKCKHCKSDLREMRGPRAAAPAPLPSLASAPISVSTPVTAAAITNGNNGHAAPLTNGNGHARRARGYEPSPSQEPAIPSVISPYDRNSAQVLPPRVTGRHAATGTAADDPRSALRHWPIVVIVLAVIAILAAIALLVWPPSNDAAGGKKAKAALDGPAPEHMDTNALPPDPKPPIQPMKPARPEPPTPPAPPTQPLSPDDPWSQSNQGLSPPPQQPQQDPDDDLTPHLKTLPNTNGLSTRVLQRECRILRACGTANETECKAIDATALEPMPDSCPQATECLRRVSRMSCAQLDSDNMLEPLTRIAECRDALSC